MSLLTGVKLGVAALAVGAMAALTAMNSEATGPAAVDGMKTPTPTPATVDRDAHSYGPPHPEPMCKDDSLACAPGHTH